MKKILFAFLFVLSALNTAFSANPTNIQTNGDVIAITPCNENNCDTLPQYQNSNYKSIKGTIYSSDPRAGNVQNFPYRVRIEYKSNNGVHSYRSIVQPTFGFVIPAGDNGKGTVTFTVIDDRADAEEYEVLTFNTDSFDSDNGQSIVMKKKAPTRNTGSAASAGGTATKSTTMNFSATLVYEDSDGTYKPIVNATVTDQNNTNVKTKTNTSGNFTIACTVSNSQCSLLFEARNQAPYSINVTQSDNDKRIPYRNYQRTSTSTRTPSSGTSASQSSGTSTDQGSLNTISGVIYEGDTRQPAIQATITPQGQSGTRLKTDYDITNDKGEFTVVNFPRNTNAEVQYMGYQTKIIPASELKQDMAIYLEASSTFINAASVSAVKCGEAEKKQFNAAAVKVLNNEKCIPAACLGGYTLQKENTADAFCKPCSKADVPFARDVKVENNKCVARNCLDGFREQNGACVLDCNSDRAKNRLNATAAAPKTNAPAIPANATAQNLDYSQYCKATACDETKYTLTNDICESLKGTKCIGPMHEVEPRATLATFDGNGYCVLEECESGYNATKDRPTRKCDSHLTGLSCRGECKIAANTPCDSSEISAISHAISGTKEQLKDGTIVCKPTCWENYNANLNGNAYECKFASDKCPNEIIRQIKTKVSNADKMIVVATPDEENNYWKDGKIFNCKITACTKGFHANEDGTACEQNLCKCSEKWDGTKCVTDFTSGTTPCDNKTAPKLRDYANAKTAVKTCDSDDTTPYCKIQTCESKRYVPDTQSNKCVDQVGNTCTVDKDVSGQYASNNGQYYYDKHADKLVCIPESCTRTGYQPNQKTGVCEQKNSACPDEFLKGIDSNADDGTITEWNDDGSVKSCQITHCLNDLVPEDGVRCVDSNCGCGEKYNKDEHKCVAVPQNDPSRECNKGLPRHATAPGVQMCRNNNSIFVESCTKAEKCKSVCVVQKCENGYNPNPTTNKCEVPTGPCDFNGNNAQEKGTWEEKSGAVVCKPVCIGSNYEPDWDAQTRTYTGCVIKRDREGKRCPSDVLKKYQHASRGEITKQDANGNVTECKITACDRGYNLDEKNNQCVFCACGTIWDATSTSCKTWAEMGKTSCDPMPDGATTAVRTCKDKSSGTDKTDCGDGTCTEYCKITACDTDAGYTLDEAKNECISGIGKPCTSEHLSAVDAHATAGVLRKKGDKVVCVITECDGLYTPASDGSSCRPKPMLTEEEHREKIGALAENAQKMRENETSLKNRIIGAAGIGMTGIGGTMVGDALSSRAAELSAEQDMAAYLQSMYCEYGNGTTVRGGETAVELPGGNDMIDLYTQYAQLANDLKIRKEALGIRPGIESEVVIDKAETGLYDDVGTGITGGTYASIARALLYPDGEDAAKWAQMRAATDAKLKAGAIVAGVGAVGSGVANYIVNHDVKNNADEIIRKYEALRKPFANLQNNANKQPQKTCAEVYRGSTGSDLDNCECVAPNAYLTNDGCVQCGQDFRVNDEKNGCVCADPQKTEQNGRCEYPSTPAPVESVNPEDDSVVQECKLAAHLRDTNDCKCVMGAIEIDAGTQCACNTSAGYVEQRNACVCDTNKGYIASGDKCVCNPKNYVTQPDGTCKAIVVSAGTAVAEASIPADANQHTLFASGKAIIQDSKLLDDFINEVKGIPNLDLTNANNYCVVIIGKTDHQGFKSTSAYYGKGGGNQKLSEDRANAVKNYFEAKQIFANDAIRSYGIAATDCPEPQRGESRSNSECRRVDIKMLTGSCADNLDNPMPWLNTMVSQQAIQTVQNLIK